jgi:hypothetical protein
MLIRVNSWLNTCFKSLFRGVMKQTVLIIDDEAGIRESLSVILGMEGYEVECAESAYSGLRLIDEGKSYDFKSAIFVCPKWMD